MTISPWAPEGAAESIAEFHLRTAEAGVSVAVPRLWHIKTFSPPI
jgi:hypothetical protein